MTSAPHWSFGAFQLDPATTCLWRDDQLVPLPPKPFAVLAYLVTHASQVVTKDELLEAVWPETVVSEGVLKTCMGQIRQALGETARTPQNITTVHRRGYRFIAPVTVIEQPSAAHAGASLPHVASVPSHLSPQSSVFSPVPMVARETELAQLYQYWTQALQGKRQLVFVTGEAGIGKTTLVDAFVAQVMAPETVWMGRGQCIEQYGSGEAYLPLLEALGQLGRSPDGSRLVALLRQQAPSWLLQMPALISATEYDVLQQRSRTITGDHMLRELAEAIEALTAERPVVVVLEDLHWSDYATLDWLTFIAHRRGAARLLVVGTYRPADAVMRSHPVRTVSQELHRHGQAMELPLPYLQETGVATYLAQRFGEAQLPDALARVLHQRTNGNPFFLVMIVEDLVRQGHLELQAAGWTLRGNLEAVAMEVPESVRQLIDHQLEHSSSEAQEVLAAASVVGVDFSAAAVAACLDQATDEVEAQCDALVRRGQFVRAQGMAEWPDGTVAARYGFIHGLYHEIIYDRVPTSRRMRWHEQIGVRLEVGYGERTWEVAAELAAHFVRGRDAPRAVHYLQVAGEQARHRNAYQEVISHLTTGLEELNKLPPTLERTQRELDMRVRLGTALHATKGPGVAEVEHAYSRAYELCQQVGETPQLFPVLVGLWRHYQLSAEQQRARRLGEQLLSLAHHQGDTQSLAVAHRALGQSLFYLGELIAARTHLEQALALYDLHHPSSSALLYGGDPVLPCLYYTANTLWLLGYPDRARTNLHTILTLTQEDVRPFDRAVALFYAARLLVLYQEAQIAQAHIEVLMEIARAQGYTYLLVYGDILRGRILTLLGQHDEGVAQMQRGLASQQGVGTEATRPIFLTLLVSAYEERGRAKDGLRIVTEAQTKVNKNNDRNS